MVTFDTQTKTPIRSIHVAGTLHFDPSSDTRLDVGLIKIQAGDDPSESGFDCEFHAPPPDASAIRPALEIGTADEPIGASHSAVIRLCPVAGLDPEECPAIICCGGRWDVHGRATWPHLGQARHALLPKARQLDAGRTGADWRVGDRVIITATRRSIAPIDNKHPQPLESLKPRNA